MKSKLLFILLTGAVLIYIFYLQEHSAGGIKVGETAPDFTLPGREASVSLHQYQGKVVLLNFWASWCPSCVEEMPSLEALKRRMEGKSFELLAVSLDEGGWADVDRFLARSSQDPFTMTILLDSRGDSASLYGTYQLPETYLIDKSGKVVKKYVGPRNWVDPMIVQEVLRHVEKP